MNFTLSCGNQESYGRPVMMLMTLQASGIVKLLGGSRGLGELDGERGWWSTGPEKGQISRLKTIKRTMCGRAGFDLLRHRVLEAA
jgi:hypothetical protein